MQHASSREGWGGFLRSRIPDLLAAAAIAVVMLLLMLSAQSRHADSRALSAVTQPVEAHAAIVEPSPAASGVPLSPPRPVLRLSRHPRFHQRAEVILDATGAPALDPFRGHDGPFAVKLIARVETSPPPATAGTRRVEAGVAVRAVLPPVAASKPSVSLAALSPDLSAAATEALSGASPPRHAARRAHRPAARVAQRKKPARSEPPAEPRVIIVLLPQPPWQPSSRVRPVAPSAERLAAHLVRQRGPSPNDLIMRNLRGPV